MIAYILIIVMGTNVSSIEFNSATTCYEQRERLQKELPKANLTCVKK